MAYEVFVTCDLVDCNSRVAVPQQGMMPAGWIAVKEVRVNLRAGPNQLAEQTSMFCGPRCAVKYFKASLAGGE